MVRDGERSRRRLLDAAAAEFAAHGIAGARVDRVAAASGVNKAQMYGWFGSKDGLFDAVFDDQLHRITDTVPFTADDLPGYAVALYDSYLAAPELIRLTSWNRLERVPAGDILAGYDALARPKYDAVARAQAEGRVVRRRPAGRGVPAGHRPGRDLVAGERHLRRVGRRRRGGPRAAPGRPAARGAARAGALRPRRPAPRSSTW